MNDPDRRQTSDGFDHDAMFADIVAHWNDATAEPVANPAPGFDHEIAGDGPGDPAAVDHEAVDHEASDQPHVGHQHFLNDPPSERQAPAPPPTPADIPAPQAWRAHEVDDELEEHFEPPPIAPLPAGDLQFWGILVGMCGGPLLLLYLIFFNRDAGSSWMLTAIGLSVGGFVLLVSRLPRDHQDDDDDGARL